MPELLPPTMQPFDFKRGSTFNEFYIEVEEGSELLHVDVVDACENGLMGCRAWCLVRIGLPFTRRFFRMVGPGVTLYKRNDYEYVNTVYEGDMVWLVFEDIEKRRQWAVESINA